MKAIGAVVLSGLLTAAGTASAIAQSAPRVGEVASLRNEAARSGKQMTLGESVFQNEVITTGPDSSVRITFLDQTNLAVGATSRVVLDRFVYNPASQEMVVNLSRGAFRFTSDSLDKRAYRINTPTATMGVRGTVVNIDVGPGGVSTFTTFEGTATICSRRTGECMDIAEGQSVRVDQNGNITRVNTQFTFQDYCSRNATLCENLGQRAGLQPWSSPELVILGAVGAGAIAGGLISINRKDNDPLSP